MPWSSKAFPLLAFALAGSGGGVGYRDVPAITLLARASLLPDAPLGERKVYPLQPQSDAGQDLPPDVTQGAGPRGTSGEAYADSVGFAAAMAYPSDQRWSGVTIGVAHPTLPTGAPVEITALDTGRTIVALVVGRETNAVVALSPGAEQALGIGDQAPVRVRAIVATAQDLAALRAGQAASPRLDAPATLLVALRRKLPDQRGAGNETGRPTTAVREAPVTRSPVTPAASPLRPRRGGYVVQVAALASAVNAAALAERIGGSVASTGSLHRVHLGPFADMASAQRARDGVARRGYGGARILHID